MIDGDYDCYKSTVQYFAARWMARWHLTKL
jgi:hypothetical protein